MDNSTKDQIDKPNNHCSSDCGDCATPNIHYKTCCICKEVYRSCNSCSEYQCYQKKMFISKRCCECYKYICKKCVNIATYYNVTHTQNCSDLEYGKMYYDI